MDIPSQFSVTRPNLVVAHLPFPVGDVVGTVMVEVVAHVQPVPEHASLPLPSLSLRLLRALCNHSCRGCRPEVLTSTTSLTSILVLVSASDNFRLLAYPPRPPVSKWIGLGSRSCEALRFVVLSVAFPVFNSRSPFSSPSPSAGRLPTIVSRFCQSCYNATWIC